MKMSLEKFHHSELDGRKINVELTAGGGGTKSEERNRKIKDKNEALNEERARRVKKLKEKEANGEKANEDGGEQKEAEGEANNDAGGGDGMHPSRRAMIDNPEPFPVERDSNQNGSRGNQRQYQGGKGRGGRGGRGRGGFKRSKW